MSVITLVTAVLLSLFSTAVMSYVAMAIPIGPWVAPILVLFAVLIFRIFCSRNIDYSKDIALTVLSGSVGGIVATALGFYFTTLYFLDPEIFDFWMKNPHVFVLVVTILCLAAGGFGIWIANIFDEKLIIREELSFPIGQLVYKTISAQKQIRKGIELIIGFVSTFIFCMLQDGFWKFEGVIRKSILIIPRTMEMQILRIPAVSLDLWPMLWALGFVTGHIIVLPLAVGVLSKIFFAGPIHSLIFSDISWMEFLITFCSGIVLSSALSSFVTTTQTLFISLKKIFYFKKCGRVKNKEECYKKNWLKGISLIETVILFVLIIAFLTYFNFSFISQLYLLIFTFICTYQVVVIAGKTGLAAMGKFVTFVMVPAMFLFGLLPVQVVLLATFVGICSGVSADILFGRKLAHLAGIAVSRVKLYQYIGLFCSSLVVGIIFWFLINHFQLGSEKLFAVRGYNRWLLINTLQNIKSFNYYVVVLGCLFGFFLSKVKINPLLVLGGLFLPVNIIVGLVIGGLGALLVKDKEQWYPFWSGVYASNSIWILLRAIM